MDAAVLAKPPTIEVIGRRLRAAYARAQADGYRHLPMGSIRKLPYAYWCMPEAALPALHPALVKRYWSEALSDALRSTPRRAKRWLTPLFFTYCESFNPGAAVFQDFARRLAVQLPRGEGEFARRLMTLHGDVAFFDPARVPERLAAALVTHPKPLDVAFESYLLWPKFVDTALGAATFEAALGLGDTKLSEWEVIARILDWAGRLGAPVVKSPQRVRFADALLRPWRQRQPPESVKAALVEFLVRVYGDPRVEGNRMYQWRDVSPQALAVLMNWLAGDTLRGFMRVLERTADEIWRHRQKFWMAYYDAGYIQEAWLALGTEAASFARRLQATEQGLGYGRLDSGASPDQSVLLLKIGNLVFTEWSHNGSLRAYREDDRQTPELYQRRYHGQDLRGALSMDFHDGLNQNPELRHMNSQGGTWQRKARDFIRQHTGIHLNDRDIL
jgi:hypothetical protein